MVPMEHLRVHSELSICNDVIEFVRSSWNSGWQRGKVLPAVAGSDFALNRRRPWRILAILNSSTVTSLGRWVVPDVLPLAPLGSVPKYRRIKGF